MKYFRGLYNKVDLTVRKTETLLLLNLFYPSQDGTTFCSNTLYADRDLTKKLKRHLSKWLKEHPK